MSEFFDSVMQGLQEAIAIQKGEIEMVEVPDMPAPTYRSSEVVNELRNKQTTK